MAANELITDDVIAKESLMIVQNSLKLTKLISRRWEPKFARDGQKIGDHISIRKPLRWEGREGETMVVEGARETSVLLKVDRMIGQDLEFSGVDLTLKVEMFKERYLDTACASIANRIDAAVAAEFINCPNFAGVPQVVPAALDSYFDASVILSNYGVPSQKRSMVVSPRAEVTIVNALKGLFQSAQALSKQYETAMMGHVIGFDWYMDQNIKSFTAGPIVGSVPLVVGNGNSGATITMNGYPASAANRHLRGDCVTFANTNGVNPMSRDSTAELRQFVVTADTASAADGTLTLPIFPDIILEGPYRNVDVGPISGAAMKTFGSVAAYSGLTFRQGMAIHKEWLTAAFVDLPLWKNMEMSARAHDPETGVAIRILKGNDIKTNQQLTRLDVMFGLKQMYEDFGCRVCM